MTGGRGPAMTGGPGYIRDGAAPYREPGSRKPEDAFALLLEAGANPNAKGPDGATLLHQAAQAGNLEMIRALADAKVDFTRRTTTASPRSTSPKASSPPERAARARGGAPPAGGGRGRGGRGGEPAGRREAAA